MNLGVTTVNALKETMADKRRQYEKPQLKRLAGVIALLQCWAQWRGTVKQVMGLKSSPQCNLGRWMRLARQGGEQWEHNLPEYREIFDDEVMGEVDRVVAGMPQRLRDTVFLVYVNGRYLSPRQRAKRLQCTERMYYYRLKEVHDIVDAAVDWDAVERR